MSWLVLVPLPGYTCWFGGVSISLKVKWVEVEVPNSLLSMEPGVGAEKLSGVISVLKVADSDDTAPDGRCFPVARIVTLSTLFKSG